MSTEQVTAHTITTNGSLEVLQKGMKVFLALSIAAVAFGGCVVYLPKILEVVNMNQRLKDVEVKLATHESSIQKIDTNFAAMNQRNDIYREVDLKSQDRLASQMSMLQGAIEGIKTSITAVQTDSINRMGILEGRVAGIREGTSNALRETDTLRDRVTAIEVEKAAAKQ